MGATHKQKAAMQKACGIMREMRLLYDRYEARGHLDTLSWNRISRLKGQVKSLVGGYDKLIPRFTEKVTKEDKRRKNNVLAHRPSVPKAHSSGSA